MDTLVIDVIHVFAALLIIVPLICVVCGLMGIKVHELFTAAETNTNKLQDSMIMWWLISASIAFYLGGIADALRGDSIVYVAFIILGSAALWAARYMWKQRNPGSSIGFESSEELERIRTNQADDDPNWKPDTKSINPS